MKTNTLIQQALTFIVLVISSVAIGQVAGSKHQKLVDLYVMNKYEDCYVKAVKMTENDKYKSESEPYLWVALCNWEFLNDQELLEYYPKAKKDALKYAVKFKKKDDKLKAKEKDYIFDENIDFIYELIRMGLVEGKSFLAMDNYSKAQYYYKACAQLDPENMDCKLMQGVIYVMNKNVREGQVLIDEAMEYYKKQAELGGFETNEATHMAFEDGFMYYIKYLRKKGANLDAFNVAALAVKLEPKNPKFIKIYKELNGE
jgi:tetratricopeptide (TPR) repeat protein